MDNLPDRQLSHLAQEPKIKTAAVAAIPILGLSATM